MNVETIICWLNANDGALMVLITLVYVIATILICVFNGLSASAAKQQIEESNKQQKQNAGIQLYDLRKQIIRKFNEKDYNGVFFDIPILFSDEIDKKFQPLAFKQGEIKRIQSLISEWEDKLRDDNYEAYVEYLQLSNVINQFSSNNEALIEKLYSLCDSYTYTFKDAIDNEIKNLNYRDLTTQSAKLSREIDGLHTTLFLEMENFIKDSIS